MKKILIIGYGSAGQRHERNVLALGWTTDIYDPHVPEKSIDKSGWDEYDGFILACPTEMHYGYLPSLMSYEKPILVEKPAVGNSKEWYSINIMKGSEKVYVAYQLRFLDSLQRLRRAMKMDDFGAILEVNIKYGHDIRKWERPGHPPYEKRDGVLMEASHELDYLKWLFPDIYLCATSLSHGEEWGDLESSASFIFGNNTDCLFNIRLNYTQPEYERSIEIIGEKRTQKINLDRPSIQAASGLMMREFLDFVTGEIEPKTLATLEDSEWVLSLIEEIRE